MDTYENARLAATSTGADTSTLPHDSSPTECHSQVVVDIELDALETVDLFDETGKRRKESDLLIEIGRRHELFHDDAGVAYARVQVSGHAEVHTVDSRAYRETLARSYFVLTHKGANKNALTDALTTLSSLARFGCKSRRVWIRTACDGPDIVLDLGTPDWRCIRISPSGWRLENGGQVMFLRPGKPLPLPEPADCGDFSLLWNHINIAPEDRVLVAAFLLASLRPSGPYPLLVLSGEQGAGKSTVARILKNLVDPSTSPLRAPPKDVRDLLVGARNTWMLCLDNVSHLPAELSDALCRLSTGGAIAERTLYSNLDETLVEVCRPIIANGIEEITTRPDLAERSIQVELYPITHRRTEEELWREFNIDAPKIYSGLLGAAAMATRDVGKFPLTNPPRMADFAYWAEAGLPAMGFERDEFSKAHRRNVDRGLHLGLESHAVGRSLLRFLDGRETWSGSAADLLNHLSRVADDSVRRSPAWPQSTHKLHAWLVRLGPALRSVGFEIERSRTDQARLITLRRTPSGPSNASVPSDTCQPDTPDVSDAYMEKQHSQRTSTATAAAAYAQRRS